MRGRKPKPTAIKERDNSFARHPERRNHDEPQPKIGRPQKPQIVAMCEIASAEWDSITQELEDMRVLTEADRANLTIYCTNFAEWVKLQKHVRENGYSTMNDKGNVSQTPEAVQVHRYADRCLKILIEIGMTPSSRSRMIKNPEEKSSPLDSLINLMSSRN